MTTVYLLVEQIFSWIEQKERCAKQLRKLAWKLESLWKKRNTRKRLGGMASLFGASCLIGAGVASFFTGGTAAVALGVVGAVHVGGGVATSAAAKITQHFSSSQTMKKVQKIEKKTNKIAEKIKKLFPQLKAEVDECSFTDHESEEVIELMSTTEFKTTLQGRAMGRAVRLAFDKWTDLIKKNNLTEACQSLRETADNMLTISRTLRMQFHEIRHRLEIIADRKRCLENSKRSSKQKKALIEIAIDKCEDEAVKKWLRKKSTSKAFLKLLDMFYFLQQELDNEEDTIDCEEDIHITFLAHGAIEASMIPASFLLPLPTISDVVLYSPWNCAINADVAYGVATGCIKPRHRIFSCRPNEGCKVPDEGHQPTNLPHCWNSMKKAGRQEIPNIFVSTLKKSKDGVWQRFKVLKDEHGQLKRNRIVIPFILPGWIGSSMTVPFSVITLALALGLLFSKYKATVHLAACLVKTPKTRKLNKDELNAQYAYTMDNTGMKPSEGMFLDRDTELYRAFKAVFG